MSSLIFMFFLVSRMLDITPFMVEGQSMDPTLHEREIFLIDRNLNRNNGLERGDIVVFSFDGKYYYVKRVIGLPGETVRISGQEVAVRSGDTGFTTLVEPYLMGKKYNFGDERYFIVPEGEYLVFGDNRAHSRDSRTFTYPYVKSSQIYGRYIYP
jgi:signal peptidase I